MQLLLRRSTIWIALNIAGMCLYLYFASALWILPGQEGTPGGPGDGFYWLFFCFPILLVCLTVNGIAIYAIAFRDGNNKNALLAYVGIASLWLCTFFYDLYKAANVIGSI